MKKREEKHTAQVLGMAATALPAGVMMMTADAVNAVRNDLS